MPNIIPILITGLAMLVVAPFSYARLSHIVIDSIELAEKVSGTPDYEIVSGTFIGELDTSHRYNRIITDLEYAPRNAQGKVEYSATFSIARPVKLSEQSGVLFYDVPNRGHGYVRPDPAGHIRVISGWQGDIPSSVGLQTASVPIAKGSTNKPITGPALARFFQHETGDKSAAIMGGHGRGVLRPAPVSLDTSKAKLWREDKFGSRTVIRPDDWAFANCDSRSFPGQPNPRFLCLREGFDQNYAYILVYQAKAPKVLGIGFAATRDLVSFLRSGRPDDANTLNPAGNRIQWTVASGTSQSGNFLKSFIHLGFNADESGTQVFDGVNPNIAARQVPLNIRFGVPGGAAGTYEPGSEGTLWWSSYNDKVRNRGVSSLLDRCKATNTCPKVIETIGSAEFWGLRLSPGFVGTDAQADIPLPPNVRRYYFPSTAHGGSFGKGFLPQGDPRPRDCLLPSNPNPSWPQLRVAQQALIDWVAGSKTPPESRYPTIANGDLVPANASAMGWPNIPDAPRPDGKLNPLIDQYFGNGFNHNDLSGVLAVQPPNTPRTLPSLVPRVNSDGNEISGVPSVHLRVPLGTYTGWNVSTEGIGQGRGCAFHAGFIPFPRTRADQLASGDPRPSLEERYGDHAGFVARVREAVDLQVAEGWLFPEDALLIIKNAEDSTVLKWEVISEARIL